MNDLRSLPPGPGAPDLASLSAPDAGGGESPLALFQRLHRLLRGRYHYAIGLGLLGALLGGVAGYIATKPKYESVGLIHIRPTLPVTLYPTEQNQMPQMFTSYVQTQATYLQDSRVILKAMSSPEWRALGRGSDPADVERFKDALSVVTTHQQPEWIKVKFADRDAKAAKIAVQSLIDAYEDIHGRSELLISPGRIADLKNNKRNTEAAIADLQDKIRRIGKEFGTTNLEMSHKASFEQLEELDRQVQQLQIALVQADTEAAGAAAQPTGSEAMDVEATVSEIAAQDNQMAALVAQRSLLKSRLDSLLVRLTPRHRDVITTRADLDALQGQIEAYAQSFVDRSGGVVPGLSVVAVPRSPEAVAHMRKQLDRLTELRDKAREQTFYLNNKRMEIEDLNDQIRKRSIFLADVDKRLTQLDIESEIAPSGTSGRINIVSRGEEPYRPAFDSRKKLAAAGLMVGGGIPLALVLLTGLVDRRYRYSDEASDGRVSPPLLGILPYLPEKLRDSEQAGIAAHCVHQIRTLLQIGGAAHDRRVFAITSPTSGDGKTSLSLSLGLSFANTGARTCLIDFDLIGGGLTSAMQAKTDQGLMDAVSHGALNGHIKPTGFPNLSLVPIGTDDAQEVSRLSPESVRRVIAEAREKFDVVIVDTGPILGSIEASLVTAAADGVVLALGRGQARPQAERAIDHLANVGATLMGVVFNRAQAGDFRRAVTSASVRSVPNQGNGAGRMLPPLGPMASTLAADFRSPDDGHDDR